jgi:hypothetical protein
MFGMTLLAGKAQSNSSIRGIPSAGREPTRICPPERTTSLLVAKLQLEDRTLARQLGGFPVPKHGDLTVALTRSY